MHGVALLALAVVVSAWVPTFLSATDVTAAQVSVGGGLTEEAVGVAFNGSHIWYTLGYTEDTSIYALNLETGMIDTTLDMVDVTGRTIVPGGLAWDPNLGRLWVATLGDIDALAESSTGDGDIFEIDPIAGTVESFFSTRPITELEEPGTGIIDGLAFDARTGRLWFSPLGSHHVYQVERDGTVSSFTLPLPPEVWNAGITFDGNHLWLSLRTGGAVRDSLDGLTEITLAEFTTEGDLLLAVVSETDDIGSEDIAFDAVTFAPTCVVWVASELSPLQTVDVPCPLQVEATLHPGDVLDLEKEITLEAFSAGGILNPSPPVWWESECDPGVTVTLQPERYENVGIGDPLAFEETIEVSSDTAPGAYHCTVTFLTNPSADVTAAFEEQEIWILVEERPLPALEEFKRFKAKVEIEEDELEVEGKFKLGRGSDGIDPLHEDVTLTIGLFTVTIPAGSFTLDDDEEWEFEGVLDGMEVEMEIEAHRHGKFKFEFEVEGGDFGEIEDRVEVTLTIGDDTGTAHAKVKVDDDEDDDDEERRRRRGRRRKC